jgi:hypothetical protein
MNYEKRFDGMPRAVLEAYASDLEAKLKDVESRVRTQRLIEGCATCHGAESYKEMLANLTSVQARCTELLLENRQLRAGVLLPGWVCADCGVFTGTMREDHKNCRICDKPRPV